MLRGSLQFLALAGLAALMACADQEAPVAPSMVAERIAPTGPSSLSIVGLGGQLGGLASQLQVQDARLSALANAWADICPEPGDICPEPGRRVLTALALIQTTASSIVGTAAEMERRLGTSHPPEPGHPPDPGFPPDPCYPPNPFDVALPPDPCFVGVLGSIGNVLVVSDSRLAGIAELVPEPGDLVPEPGLMASLANIKAAAMSLAETAAELANLMSK